MIRGPRTSRSTPRGGAWLLLAGPVGLVAALGAVDRDASHDQRAAAVAALDPTARAELAEKYERYQRLPPEEREQLRQLDAALRADPDRAALETVLKNYTDWLARQSPLERAELDRMPLDERLARVRKLRADEDALLARRLSDADLAAILGWLRSRALEAIPPDRRGEFERLDPGEQQRAVWRMVWQRWLGFEGGRPPAPSELELRPLVESLSPSAQAAFQRAATPQAKRELLADWIRQAAYRQFAGREGGPPGGGGPWGPMPSVSDGELRQFFDTQLSESERKQLLELPREEMLTELRRQYYFRSGPAKNRFFGEPGPGGPGGPSGGPPGPGFRPRGRDGEGPVPRGGFGPEGPRPGPRPGGGGGATGGPTT